MDSVSIINWIGPRDQSLQRTSRFNEKLDPKFMVNDSIEDEDLEEDFDEEEVEDDENQVEDNRSEVCEDLVEVEEEESSLAQGSAMGTMDGVVEESSVIQQHESPSTQGPGAGSAAIALPTTTSTATAQAPIFLLDDHLTQLLATHLPLSSLVALAFTSVPLYNTLGAVYTHCLRPAAFYPIEGWYFRPIAIQTPTAPAVHPFEARQFTGDERALWHRVIRKCMLRRERKKFLRLLNEDMDDYVLCGKCGVLGKCGILHKPYVPTIAGVRLFEYNNMRLAMCDMEGVMPFYFPYREKTYPQISITQIQQAVHLTDRDRPNDAIVAMFMLRALAQSGRWVMSPGKTNCQRKHLWFSQPKILGNILLMRTQHWFLLPQPVLGRQHLTITLAYAVNSFDSPRSSDGFTAENIICPHVQMATVGFYSANENRRMASSVDQCCHCGTSYQIDAKDYYPCGIAFVLTVWKSLGCFTDSRRGNFKSIDIAVDINDNRALCWGHAGRISARRCPQLPLPPSMATPRGHYEATGVKDFDFESVIEEEGKGWLFGSRVGIVGWGR